MRHTPEAGAVCGNPARTDLRGGRGANLRPYRNSAEADLDGLHAPDHLVPVFFAAAQHVDKGQGALAQGNGFKAGRWLVVSQCLRNQGFALGLFLGDGRFQCRNGARHLFGQDDALVAAAGLGIFANDLQHPPSIGLQHDDVAGGFGFEFIKHRAAS